MLLTFTRYEVTDDGIVLWFHADNPGAGRETEYAVLLTDAELGAVTTQAQLRTAITTKLNRKLRATGIATKLDAFIGQSVSV